MSISNLQLDAAVGSTGSSGGEADAVPITPLVGVFAEIARKRASDVVRFRTCCADPRASK